MEEQEKWIERKGIQHGFCAQLASFDFSEPFRRVDVGFQEQIYGARE
ncbi:MAG: hypothetical protein MPW16_14685 [Candidatus Manganitrophus sp.]|nr:MAG: hypothetical protein MPW16_14685 [Candidatus Manganitrophus sp.]